MRRLTLLTVLTLAGVATPAGALAQGVYLASDGRYYQGPPPGYYLAADGYYHTYEAPRTAQAAPQAAQAQITYQDEAGAFLAALNLWRSWYGRGPVGWDTNLAAFAATNAGVHNPGTSGGGGQCWAGVTSLLASLELWKKSPSHAAILLNATTAVGASRCPSGVTCNVR